ncbi:MAG: MFS transporter [Pseudomonadota bacterium]
MSEATVGGAKPAAAPAAGAAQKSGAAYSYYVLVLFTLVYTFNFIDRQIIGIISPLIKQDLGLNDAQLGVLKGFAFALFYTVLGIPIARMADRMNRVTIVSVSLALWSGFTAISGAAQNFTQLALARVGVGVGEAGGTPPSHSVISDYFPPEKRPQAMAIYAMGIPVGIALGYFAFAWLLSALQTGGVTDPGIWRTAMLLVGAPGIALAILLKLTVREPERGAADGFKHEKKTADKRPLGETIAAEFAEVWTAARKLWSIPTYAFMGAGITLASFGAYAIGTWIVDFFTRSHPEMPLTTVLIWLGFINAIAYSIGTFLGGAITERLAKKNKAMYGLVPGIALLVNGPFFLFAMWAPTPTLSMIGWLGAHLTIGFYLGPTFAVAQTLAPVQYRALSTAVLFFVLNLIALGLGPSFVGVLSEALMGAMGEERALRIALSSVFVTGVAGAVAFFIASRQVEKDWPKETS